MKFILIIFLVLLVIWLIRKEIKSIHEPNVFCITGGVKTGKTTLTFKLARRRYRRILLKYYITYPFVLLFKRYKPEKPLFYTNCPVKWKHVRVDEDLLMRRKRFNYKSVVVLQEASLIADSMNFKDDDLNDNLKMFFKLFGHETKGGYCYIDTQNLKDVHYNIKRSFCTYLWIHRAIKWIPFIYICKVREMFYSDEQGVINTFNEDVEDTTRYVFISKRIRKYFDGYTYSILTDDLPIKSDVQTADNLKTSEILTFDKKKEVKKSANKK